jgi:hypothetical protein
MDGTFAAAYAAARYGLAGRTLCDHPAAADGDSFRQVRLDIDLDKSPLSEESMTAVTSITSICAHAPDLPISGPLTLFPRPDANRLGYLARCRCPQRLPETQRIADMLDIPNFLLGKFGEYGVKVHVVFPRLFHHTLDPKPRLAPLMDLIHKQILYPALKKIFPRHSSDYAFLTEPAHLPPLSVLVTSPSKFASAFRAASEAAAVPELRDSLFVFTLDTPMFPSWPAGDTLCSNRAVALTLVKGIFPAGTDVWVELSTDIRSGGRCLRFKSDSHLQVLKWACPNSNGLVLQSLIRRPGRFHFKSHVSYLATQMATFSILPDRSDLLETGIVGVTTTNLDTESTYGNSPIPRFPPQDLYPEHLAGFVTKLANLCNQLNPDIPGDSRATREDAGVRVSVLVNATYLDQAMLHSPLPHASQWLAAYESRWWRFVVTLEKGAIPAHPNSSRSFVWTRVRMFAIAAEMLYQAEATGRATLNTIQFGIAISLLLNHTLSSEVDSEQHAEILNKSTRGARAVLGVDPIDDQLGHGFDFLSDLRLLPHRGRRAPALPSSALLADLQCRTVFPPFFAAQNLQVVQRRMVEQNIVFGGRVRIHPLTLPDDVEEDEVELVLGL